MEPQLARAPGHSPVAQTLRHRFGLSEVCVGTSWATPGSTAPRFHLGGRRRRVRGSERAAALDGAPLPTRMVGVTGGSAGLPITLCFEGELAADTVNGLREEVRRAVVTGGPDVMVDLCHVQFLDAAGIALLIELADRVTDRGGVLLVSRASPVAADLLEIVRFDEVVAARAAMRHDGRGVPPDTRPPDGDLPQTEGAVQGGDGFLDAIGTDHAADADGRRGDHLDVDAGGGQGLEHGGGHSRVGLHAGPDQ